jgi:hypothetical protein
MAKQRKRTRSRNRTPRDANPDALATVRINGDAPESRIKRASQCYNICKQLVDNDVRRAAKRERLYKAYKRFPPTDYSTLIELKQEDQSNVNWGMMAFILNNTKGSFYDMIAERSSACDIQTKIGDPIERRIFSDLISEKYDLYCLREDYSYLMGQEISILDMSLYGKGIHIWEDIEGFKSEPCPARDFYVPEDTNISLDKFDLFVRRKKYHLYELQKRIENRKEAEDRGWNVEAVIDAMRYQRDDWLRSYTNEDFMHDVAAGKMALTSVMKEVVHVFEMYLREFDGSITRMAVLGDFSAAINLVNESAPSESGADEDDLIDECGFLMVKMNYAKDLHEVVTVFLDNAGSGEWHDTPSLAEEIFVQCRQYDVTMNSIMDAIKLNMSLMLQGATAEATEKLKQMVWGQYTVLPPDMPFAQSRIALPTTEATQTIQFMMTDLYSGIGHYRVQQTAPSGDSPTATQRQLDAAESAKLSGTQIRRFNEQQTIYHKERYRRFISLTKGAKGYEQFEKFKDCLKEYGVPEKAWKMENIETFASNMIAGPGSPSYKMMASDKIIAYTNMTPKDDGQRAAIEDGIAGVAGRQNVRRYLPPKKRVDPGWEDKYMGIECELFSDVTLNPKNVQVTPDQNHIAHISYHLDDMATTIMQVQDQIQKGTIKKEFAEPAMFRLLHEGAHIGAHMQFLMRDTGKAPLVKEFQQKLAVVQKAAEQIQQQLQQLLDAQNAPNEFDPANDPDIQKKIAMGQLEVSTAEKIAQIKLGAAAQSHAVKDELARDKAATEIATTRAKATADIQNSAAKAAATPPKPKPSR